MAARPGAWILGLLAALGLPRDLPGDQALTYREWRAQLHPVLGEAHSEAEWKLSWRSDRARLERGGQTFILRRDLGKLWILNHATATYQEVPLPAILAQHVRPEARRDFETLVQLLTPVVEVTETGEESLLAGRRVRATDLSVVYPVLGDADRIRLWLEEEPGVDVRPANQVLRLFELLNRFQEGWTRGLGEANRLLVRSESRLRMQRSNPRQLTVELQSLGVEDTPADAYTVPATYRQTDYFLEFSIHGRNP